MLENKKILITGGAGFIGSNLCERFVAQSNEVICLDNFLTGRKINIEPLLSKSNFTLIEGDIRDFEMCKKAVKGVDVVLHQAALGSVPRSINDPITTNSINVSGFLNMLKSADEEGVKRFVYAASSSTYGDSKSLPKVEDEVGKPLSPYAVTKLVNELYANVFSSLYSIETIGLRYFNVFGRKQDPDGAYAAAIPKFVKAFIDYKSPVIHGDGEQSRDFTYIDNVIQANELAATTTNADAVNQVYNVAYGENTTLNELVPLLRELLTKFDAKISNIQVAHDIGRFGDIKHSLASIDKAFILLGYKPTYTLKQGLVEAIDWYWNDLK
ncbi:MAG: SDR family oxidoreductase [Flavobacteriales bacterium]|nr:SDR family oxidoreductase [Flavobacteriales bacterium]